MENSSIKLEIYKVLIKIIMEHHNIITIWTSVNTTVSYGLIYNHGNHFNSTYFDMLAYSLT